MKKLLPVLVLAAVVAGRVAAEPMTIDGYAAIVNDHVITVGEVLEFILPVEEQLRINYAGRVLAAKRTEAFTNGVQRLVEQQLIVEDFKKNGGVISEVDGQKLMIEVDSGTFVIHRMYVKRCD